MRAVCVVILAGGEGMRIGGGKPLKSLAGERLIDHALEQARAWSELIAVSVRDAAQVGSLDSIVVVDEPTVEGPLSGLISALRFAEESGCDFLLTIPTDMPFLPAELLSRLSNAIGDRACALANSGGHLHPVCGLWRVAALNDVDCYVASGKRSLRGFAEAVGFAAAEWPTEPTDPFFNINTPGDLARAERLLSEI